MGPGIEVRPATGAGRVAEVVDRILPLAWLGIYLLLPVSGWADLMFESWFDQKRDLEALRSVLEEGESDTVADNAIGPAYVALAALLHDVLGLSPENALVALNRASYAVSVAGGMALVRVIVRRLVSAPPAASLAAQFAFVALAFTAGTWYWSDVPWSHFLAACLGVLVYASRFVPERISVAGAGIVGATCALLVLTRSFEAVALLLAWALALAVLAALRIGTWRPPGAAHVLTGGVVFAATAVAVHVATGKREPFLLYSSGLGRQSGDLPSAEVAETPTFSPLLVPVKLVQLFVEPCFYSMCRLSDYAGTAEPLTGSLVDSSGQERLWRLPLAVQLPSLAFLPICVIVVGALLVWLARNRTVASAHGREARLLVETTIASSGIVLGYAASTLTGPSHLRFGFARDFLLPAALTGVLVVSLGAAGMWLLLSRSRGLRLWPTRLRVSPEGGMILGALVAALVLGTAVWAGRTHGLPRIESRQLGPIEYTAQCGDTACDVRLVARTVAGEPISIPEASMLTFGCGSDAARFSIYVQEPSDGVPLDRLCPEARLVAAWPTVMGLPPGRGHLYAVDVENVRQAG